MLYSSIKVFKEQKFAFQDIVNQVLILQLLLSSQSRSEAEMRRSRFHRRFSPWTFTVCMGFDAELDGWIVRGVWHTANMNDLQGKDFDFKPQMGTEQL